MSQRVVKMLKDYPDMVRERNCLVHQIANFRGVSAEEVIQSMYTPRADGERVQTSNISDKTSQIAFEYKDRQDTMNREWYQYLEDKMLAINSQICFLESALRSLSGILSGLMWDMVVQELKWDAIQQKYNISRTTVYRHRRRAIAELDKLYKKHDIDLTAYMLQ